MQLDHAVMHRALGQYTHPCFQRGNFEQLALITRRRGEAAAAGATYAEAADQSDAAGGDQAYAEGDSTSSSATAGIGLSLAPADDAALTERRLLRVALPMLFSSALARSR